jgi:hypothetical protein
VCGVNWRGVNWRGVNWRGVNWRGVNWRGDWRRPDLPITVAAALTIAGRCRRLRSSDQRLVCCQFRPVVDVG